MAAKKKQKRKKQKLPESAFGEAFAAVLMRTVHDVMTTLERHHQEQLASMDRLAAAVEKLSAVRSNGMEIQ